MKKLSFFKKMKIVIPTYQRGYAWSVKKEVMQFYNDIIQDTNDHYFIGFITCKVNNNEYEIIDGQQRLTTLYLIQLAIGDENIFKLCKKIRYENPEWNDWLEKFENRVKRNEKIDENDSKNYYQNNIISTLNYFKKNKIEKKILDKLIIDITDMSYLEGENNENIKIKLDNHIVFDKINSRGKALTYLEKLKNRLIAITIKLGEKNKKIEKEITEEIKNITDSFNDIYENLGEINTNGYDDKMLFSHWLCYEEFHYTRSYANPWIIELFDFYFNLQRIDLSLDKDQQDHQIITDLKIEIEKSKYSKTKDRLTDKIKTIQKIYHFVQGHPSAEMKKNNKGWEFVTKYKTIRDYVNNELMEKPINQNDIKNYLVSLKKFSENYSKIFTLKDLKSSELLLEVAKIKATESYGNYYGICAWILSEHKNISNQIKCINKLNKKFLYDCFLYNKSKDTPDKESLIEPIKKFMKNKNENVFLNVFAKIEKYDKKNKKIDFNYKINFYQTHHITKWILLNYELFRSKKEKNNFYHDVEKLIRYIDNFSTLEHLMAKTNSRNAGIDDKIINYIGNLIMLHIDTNAFRGDKILLDNADTKGKINLSKTNQSKWHYAMNDEKYASLTERYIAKKYKEWNEEQIKLFAKDIWKSLDLDQDEKNELIERINTDLVKNK